MSGERAAYIINQTSKKKNRAVFVFALVNSMYFVAQGRLTAIKLMMKPSLGYSSTKSLYESILILILSLVRCLSPVDMPLLNQGVLHGLKVNPREAHLYHKRDKLVQHQKFSLSDGTSQLPYCRERF